MSSENAQLLNKYSNSSSEKDKSSAALYHELTSFKPDWAKYAQTAKHVDLLKLLRVGAPGMETMLIMKGNLTVMQACLDSLTVDEEKPVQWVATLLCDMVREESSSYSVFEDAFKADMPIFGAVAKVLMKGFTSNDFFTADKAVWLLTALIGHIQPTDLQVETLVGLFTNPAKPLCSELGRLEGVANLLKSDVWRAKVWTLPRVPDCVFGVSPQASSPMLYKCVFAMWMLSFDTGLLDELVTHRAVLKIRSIIASSRVEKVVRICLTVLRAMLQNDTLSAEVVEANVLDAVQNLEFEKWRDAELYEDIRDLSSQISSRVQELSNFARYEKELASGSLHWGFIHTSKFWAENFMKFEQNDFKALKSLEKVLIHPGTDSTSLAVACHDIGQFVSLHPLGKKKVAQYHIKERIMELMGSVGDDKREVRREALLCCQKIMLNKWQDMEKAK